MARDPFEALRLSPAPLAPRASFAAELRTRIERALRDDDAGTGSEEIPVDEQSSARLTITPYLCVADAAGALAWYRDVFDAVETLRYVGDDGRIGHAEITIRGATVMLADPFPEIGVRSPSDLGGVGVSLVLDGVDVDVTYERAVHAGAIGSRPPADQEHGHRTATVLDPYGHRWMLSRVLPAQPGY